MSYTTQTENFQVNSSSAASPMAHVFTDTSNSGNAIAADFYVQLTNFGGNATLHYGGSWFNLSESNGGILLPGQTSPPIYVKGTTSGGDSKLYFSFTAPDYDSPYGGIILVTAVITMLS